MNTLLDHIREATRSSIYDGQVYLVGGVLRDEQMPSMAPAGTCLPTALSDDIDLVLEGSATDLAQFLAEKGLSDHTPVLYPRFGTAMLTIQGMQLEIVTARAESYDSASRKPDVRPASLIADAMRRDFTINTLMRNLHTGELLDLTGRALEDIRAGLIRTPLDPLVTFNDDPLRMLRAVRFASRFRFRIDTKTEDAIRKKSNRLDLIHTDNPVVSAERIRDEFCKMMMCREPAGAVEMLRGYGLLEQFAPELLAMIGYTQNAWHIHDVWDHTMGALASIREDAPLEWRLAVLLHDIGKTATRTEDERGIHFYEHQFVGAQMANVILHRLKFSNEQIRDITTLVEQHMRLGEARPGWSDAAVKRLIRDVGERAEALFEIGRCDISSMSPDAGVTDLAALRHRMEELERMANVTRIQSPLDGVEIMTGLNIPGGPVIRKAKEFLINEIIDGRLPDGDKQQALARLAEWYSERV